MNDTDAKLMYKRMAELNISIINLGKEISGLKKAQEALTGRLDSFPKEVFTATDKTVSKTSLDELKSALTEMTMTTNETQKTVDTIFDAFTREKATK